MEVTQAILMTCTGLFVLQLFLGSFAPAFGMIPAAVARGEWWRLFTSTLLHNGLSHVAFNMLALYWLGPPMERSLGPARFAALYVLAGLGGSVASYWFSELKTMSTGASGALFGLIAAAIVLGRQIRADVSQLVALLGLNVVVGFVLPGIDWRAHLGGAATGAALAFTRNPVGIVVALGLATLVRSAQIRQLF